VKILHVIMGTHPSEGGPIENTLQTARVLVKRGHTVEIASLDPEDALWLKDLDIRVYPLGSARDRYLNAPRLKGWLIENANDYDVVLQHGLWNPTSFATWRAMKKTGQRYVTYPHGMLDPYFRGSKPLKHVLKQMLWFVADGRLLKDSQLVLFTTEEERLSARRSFWPCWYREKVVNYGTADVPIYRSDQTEAFQKMLPAVNDRPFLLFLSRIHPKKGCDILIEAFGRVAQTWPDVHLVIAGPDEAGLVPQLQSLAVNLGIQDRVHWPGMLKGPEKWGALRSCTGFVLPSHQENFGVVVAEAMACARPVLITNKVQIWREVKSANAGIVANDDVDGVASLLTSFLELPQSRRDEMGRNAREGFSKYFEITHVADALVPILTEVAGKPRDVYA
jgi:glycosyltransferase involved in cell wall biosynthesis